MSKLKTFSILLSILFFIVSPALYSQVIKDDFRVNDDTTGGTNHAPDVEITESGEEIIVWSDGRNSVNNIYGQAYDNTGNPLDINFKVSTNSVILSEYYPAISSYGDSLLVIWYPGYGQWLLSDGSKEGGSFHLQSGSVQNPDVVVSDSGFFVVWYNSVSGSGYEIFIKRFDFNGDSISSRALVNDDGTSQNQQYPRLAMDNDGNFVVVWQDYRDGDSDVYGQLFDPAGNKTGNNFLINDDGGSSQQYSPSCAMDSAGNFVVVWQDYRDGNSNIYGQRFDASGDTTGLGGNFLINDDAGSSHQSNPSCSMDSAGNFVVVWRDYRDGNYNIYGQRFGNNGNSLGVNFRMDQSTGSGSAVELRVSMNGSNFVVTWRNSNASIYKRRFLNDGTPADDEVKVNDHDGTANQYAPAIDINTSGNVVVAWSDSRDPWGIYFQRLNTLGDILGSNIYIGDGYYPDVAVAEDSSFIITYYGNSDIYYQRFMPSGDSIGSPIVISDTTYNSRYYPVTDMDSDKNAVVAWHDYRNNNPDIYAQMVDSEGDTVGGNFKVNNDPGTENQFFPSIAMSPSSRFLIAWQDYREGNYDIYGQVYDSDRNPVGSNFRIDSGGSNNQQYPDAGYLPDGNYIVVWEDYRAGGSGVHAQIIDSMGALVDTNFKVSDQSGYRSSVGIAPSGEFVVTWRDYRDGNYNIYAQKYNSDYSPHSTDFKVNNELEGLYTTQDRPDVATDGNNIIFTWEDAKWQKGDDIAAKVFSWEQGGIEDVKTEGKGPGVLGISGPILMGKEWLMLSVDSPSEVDFKIINVAGIVVSSKKLNYAAPGIKKVDFDVSKLPSGPYFLSFKTEEGKAVKKAMVIR